ncbi:MAG: class I SAM-dependent methyltransferase [Alphaproteobacteria bacterium]|nr:class I SAM-dependent methyltransferase [Alphaproteobacteria bacterium]
MKGQTPHDILPDEHHDEVARQEFVTSFKVHVLTDLGPGNKRAFENRGAPAFQKTHGHQPKSARDVARVMHKDPFWQTWSSLNRSGQELMWEGLSERTGRQLDDLAHRARDTAARKNKKGSLRLDPTLKVPRYNSEIHIHCQPGGYHAELAEDDVSAGALYDVGAYQYGMGGQGPMTDDVGVTVGGYFRRTLPAFAPARILDLGCGVGHQTLGLAEAFPEAEIHGCDLGPGMLRYAHARAESVGQAVHFSQQNAERTDYPDESFDLVTSMILFHETSHKAIPNIINECYRLLKPGGYMVHGDVPEFNKYWPEPYDQFQRDWTTHFNAEPFRSKMRDMDMPGLAKKAGFKTKSITEALVPSVFGEAGYARTSLYGNTHAYGMKWWVLVAQK